MAVDYLWIWLIELFSGFTRHPIEEGNAGIVVRLGQACIINHIKILLWDRDMR